MKGGRASDLRQSERAQSQSGTVIGYALLSHSNSA
jgi:hypothetical protein